MIVDRTLLSDIPAQSDQLKEWRLVNQIPCVVPLIEEEIGFQGRDVYRLLFGEAIFEGVDRRVGKLACEISKVGGQRSIVNQPDIRIEFLYVALNEFVDFVWILVRNQPGGEFHFRFGRHDSLYSWACIA